MLLLQLQKFQCWLRERQPGFDVDQAERRIVHRSKIDGPTAGNRYSTGKSIPIFGNHVKPRNKKYFALSEGQIRGISIAIPSRPEGRRPSSRTWDGDAVDAEAATDERRFSVRQRRVVLTPRCWRQCTWRQLLLRAQRRQKSRSPGRARYKP